jgi:hypothetical protein
MDESSLVLTGIHSAGDNKYTVTLTQPDGADRTYVFTVREGEISAVEASPEFGAEVGAFGYSHLVYKVVHAFHEARAHTLGKPAWARDTP